MKLGYLVSKRIDQLANKADNSMKNSKYQEAIKYYKKIIDILPEPKEFWEAYEWAVVSIADTYFISEEYEKAQYFFELIISEANNPFILLRYGQTQYYMKELECAKKYLARAYDIGGEEVFKDENFFLELVKEKQVETNAVIEFENLFKLPEEYQYIEKEYMSKQYLWKPIQWLEIYNNYTEIFKSIPEELYTNSIAFLCVESILESAIHLNKREEFEKWNNMIEITSAKRYDSGVVETWKGICELHIGNDSEAMNYFEQAVKKENTRILKNFRHFGNDIYDYYLRNK